VAGLIKEKFMDYSLHRLSLDEYIDLDIARRALYTSDAFTLQETSYFDLYLMGYTLEEIAAYYHTNRDVIQLALERIFIALEAISGYEDRKFLYTMGLKYRRIKELEAFLESHAKNFTIHSLE
jgi:hypothetical protein